MRTKAGEGSKALAASSNWLALQKKLPSKARRGGNDPQDGRARKRRKLEHSATVSPAENRYIVSDAAAHVVDEPASTDMKNGESLKALRKMIHGFSEYTPNQRLPGKYLALDCEMVGVGIDGVESSLARVSLVNYYGAIQLDEFVRQRERVVDYRTQFSGVRETDMIKAKPFDVIQKQVAELIKDRILIGHAVFNDLKALLLSHPRPQTRDTQALAGKHKLLNTRYPALRNLVKQELGVTIQSGEHSSVTDARATMGVYRLHRKEWDQRDRLSHNERGKKQSKRKRSSHSEERDGGEDETVDADESSKFPGGGRKGVSSGLSTVVKLRKSSGDDGRSGGGGKEKSKWWKELGGSKGSIKVRHAG